MMFKVYLIIIWVSRVFGIQYNCILAIASPRLMLNSFYLQHFFFTMKMLAIVIAHN